jgi:hypothetical protein
MTRSDLKDTASVEPDNSHSEVDEKLIVGHGPLAEFLTDKGYPTSKSTIAKYCSPAINTGPPVESYWGRLPRFRPSRVLAWAKARLRPATVVHDGASSAAQEVHREPPASRAAGSCTADRRTSKLGRRHGEATAGA